MPFNPTTDGFSSDGGTITAGTPGAVQMYQLIVNMSGLALEISTGMKMSRRGSICKWAAAYELTTQDVTRETKKVKRAVLADLVKVRQKADPSYVPDGSVKRALES